MTFPRFRRYLIVIMGLAAFAWLGGLLLFVMYVGRLTEPPITPDLDGTDAIVVLTGGSDRVATGIQLLVTGKAKKLFISGVFPGATVDHVLGNLQVPKKLRDCCIMLGHVAESTMGNAEETLNWMKLEDYQSLRLVTANYHMPRSLLIFHSAMPGITIIPHPVVPDTVKLDSWWSRHGTANLLVMEYSKYLWAQFRVMLGMA